MYAIRNVGLKVITQRGSELWPPQIMAKVPVNRGFSFLFDAPN